MMQPARHSPADIALGLDRPITRRDFLNGVALAVGGGATGLAPALGLARVGLAGAVIRLATVKVVEVSPVLPAASVATRRRVWSPGVSVAGAIWTLAPVPREPPSTNHSFPATPFASLASAVAVTGVRPSKPASPLIVAAGAVLSTVIARLGGVVPDWRTSSV